METRLIEMLVPAGEQGPLFDLLKSHEVLSCWETPADKEMVSVRAVMPSGRVGDFLNEAEKRLQPLESYRIVVTPVQATLPAAPEPQPEPEEEPEPTPAQRRPRRLFGSHSISTQELVTQVTGLSALTPVFLAAVVLSSVVAVAGLLTNDTAVIIGAMVIAPLLGPNLALALSASLGDLRMGVRGACSALAGIGLALAIATVTGMLTDIDPTLPELLSRTDVKLSAITIALASGAAGALALTTGISTTLIGVMLSVALLPPTIVVGLMLGSRNWDEAGGAALLLMVNVASVNLAAIAIFLAQGVRPSRWWQEDSARRATRVAATLWLGILALLAAGILLSTD